MKYSRASSMRPTPPPAPQLYGMHAQTASDVSEPIRTRRLTVAGNYKNFSLLAPTESTNLQQPQDHSASGCFHALSTEYSLMSEEEPQVPQTFYISRSSSISSLVQAAPPPQSVQKGRYYSYALSEEDKDALTRGEQNHNLKQYTPKDIVMYHESRKELVPTGAMNKLDKMETLAYIEQSKKRSQKALGKKVRDTTKLPWFRLLDKNGVDNRSTYESQASQSMSNLRSSNILPPQLSTASQTPYTMTRMFSFDATPPALGRSSHVRATSSDDYFSRPVRSHSSLPLPSPSSGTSSRVRSPLATEVARPQVDANVTFDAFLVPHKSGKGEVVRGTANAKNAKGSKKDAMASLHGNLPAKEKVLPRRIFSRMPSMPSLSKRSSRRDLRKIAVE